MSVGCLGLGIFLIRQSGRCFVALTTAVSELKLACLR
jgi:hypothetical protein